MYELLSLSIITLYLLLGGVIGNRKYGGDVTLAFVFFFCFFYPIILLGDLLKPKQ